jgi:5-(carboxyamino)imidazole ribonucleotide synthase
VIRLRIGIIGGGQLGRMLAFSAKPLGHSVVVLEPADEVPAAAGADVIAAAYDDVAALHELAERSDVVTCEFESVPVIALETVAGHGVPVHPGHEAFRIASDRLFEKTMFRELGLRTAPFMAVDDQASLEAAVVLLGLPAVLKTRRSGYDGKGQRVLRASADVAGAFAALGSVPMILEGFVSFRRELSIVAARGQDGSVVHYDVVENVHRDGVLHTTTAPARGLDPAIADEAREYASSVLRRLDYVGVLAIELFDDEHGLCVNEMAPRVHNSGHWTIEGAVTSQFENHVRAITGAPLGSPALKRPCVMVNLVGTIPDPAAIAAIPNAHLHLYDKLPKPGRKLGHVTVVGSDESEVERTAKSIVTVTSAAHASN